MGKKTKRRAKASTAVNKNKNTDTANVGQAFRDVSLSLDKRKREQEHQQHLLQQQQERQAKNNKMGTSSDYIVNPTNVPAEEQMQSITYPHPEVFFPGEMKLQNSLEVKWNPLNSILKKKLPPLSQILFHELFPNEESKMDFNNVTNDIPDEEDLSLLSLPRHPPLTITIDKNQKKGEAGHGGRRNYQRTMLRNTMGIASDANASARNVAERMLRESGYASGVGPYEEDHSITSASYTNTTISTLDKEYSMSILPDHDEPNVRKRMIHPMKSERSYYSATSIDNSTGGYESLHHLYRHDSKRSLLSGSTMQSTSQLSLFSSDILINASQQHSSFVTGANSSPLVRHRKMMQGSSFNENFGGGRRAPPSRQLSGVPPAPHQSRGNTTPSWSTSNKSNEKEEKKNITIDLVGKSVWSSSTSAIKAAADATPNVNVNVVENNSITGEEDYDIKMKGDSTSVKSRNTPSPNSVQTYQDDNSALSANRSDDSIDGSIDSRNGNAAQDNFSPPLTSYNRTETDKMSNISVVSDGASLASKNSQEEEISPAKTSPRTTGSSLALLLKKKSQRNIMSGEDRGPSQPYGFARTLSNRIVNPVSMISIPNNDNGGTASRRGSLVSALTRKDSVGSIILTDQEEVKSTDQLQDEEDERSLKEFVNLMDGGEPDVDGGGGDGTTTHDTMDTSRSARRSTFKIKNSKKPNMFNSSERRSTFRIANTSTNKGKTINNISNKEQHSADHHYHHHQMGRHSMSFSAVNEEESAAKNEEDEKTEQNNETQQNNLRRPSQPIGSSYYQQTRTTAYNQQQQSLQQQEQNINHENFIISVPADYRRGSMVSTLSTRDDVVFNNRSFRTSLSDYQPHNPHHQNYGYNPYIGDNNKSYNDSTSFLRQASKGERARRDSHFSASIPPPLRDNQSREFFANKINSQESVGEEDQSEIDVSLCSNEQIQDTNSLQSGEEDGLGRIEEPSQPKFERMTTGKTTNTKSLVTFSHEGKYEDEEDQNHLYEKSTHSRRRESHTRMSVSIAPPLRTNESGGYFLRNANRVREIEEEAADANAHLFSDLGLDESTVEKEEEKESSKRDIVAPDALNVHNGDDDGRYPPQISPVRMISIPSNRRGSMISTLSGANEEFTNKNISSGYNRDISPRMRHLHSRVPGKPRRDSHQSHSIEAPQRRVSESIDDEFEFGGDDILQLGKKYSYVSTDDEHEIDENATLTSLDRMITGKMSNTKKATSTSVSPVTNFERMRTGKASNTISNKSTSALNITNSSDVMRDESSTAEDIDSDAEHDKRKMSPSNAVSFADDTDTKHSLDYSKNSGSISRISNIDEEEKEKSRSNISKRRSTFKVNNTTHRNVSSTSIGKSRTRVYQEASNDESAHSRIDPKSDPFHLYSEEKNKTASIKKKSEKNQANMKETERSRRRSTFKISNSSKSNGTGSYLNKSFDGDNIEEEDEELSSINSSVHNSDHDVSKGVQIQKGSALGRIPMDSPALSIEEEEDMMLQPTVNRLFSRKKSRWSPRKDLPKSPKRESKKERISPFSAKSFRKNKKERQNSEGSGAKSINTNTSGENSKHLRGDLRRNDTSSRKNLGSLIKGILPTRRDSFNKKKNKKSKSPSNTTTAMTELERAETEATNNTAVAALTELERAETEETTNTRTAALTELERAETEETTNTTTANLTELERAETEETTNTTAVAALTELERADTEETSNTVATESRKIEAEKKNNAVALAKLERTLGQNRSSSQDSVALSILEKSIAEKSQHSSNASVGHSSIANSTFGGKSISTRGERRGPKTESDYTETDVSLAPPSRKVSYEKSRRKVDRDPSCSNFSTCSRRSNRSIDDGDDFESLSAPTRRIGHTKAGSDKSLNSSSRSRRRDPYDGNYSSRSTHSIMNQSISEDIDNWNAPIAPTSLRAMESRGDFKPKNARKGKVISPQRNDRNARLVDGPSYQESRSHSRNSRTVSKSSSQRKKYVSSPDGIGIGVGIGVGVGGFVGAGADTYNQQMWASGYDVQESDQAAGPGLASFARQKAMQNKDLKKKKKLNKGDMEDYPNKDWQKDNEGRESRNASNNGKEGVRSAFFKPIYPASPADKRGSPHGNTKLSRSSQNKQKKNLDPYLLNNHNDRRSYLGGKDGSYRRDSQEFSVASGADGSVSTYDGLGTRWLDVDAKSENRSITDRIDGSTTYDGLSTRWGMSTDAANGVKNEKKQMTSSSSPQRKEWKESQSRFAIY